MIHLFYNCTTSTHFNCDGWVVGVGVTALLLFVIYFPNNNALFPVFQKYSPDGLRTVLWSRRPSHVIRERDPIVTEAYQHKVWVPYISDCRAQISFLMKSVNHTHIGTN